MACFVVFLKTAAPNPDLSFQFTEGNKNIGRRKITLPHPHSLGLGVTFLRYISLPKTTNRLEEASFFLVSFQGFLVTLSKQVNLESVYLTLRFPWRDFHGIRIGLFCSPFCIKKGVFLRGHHIFSCASDSTKPS